MTREEISRLLALEPLVSTPDLLGSLWKAGGRLIESGVQLSDDQCKVLDGIENIEGIWRSMRAYAAGECVDLISHISVFSDSGEVVSWFAEMASGGGVSSSLYREAAMTLLALHGLMALAAEAQALASYAESEEGYEDLDNEGEQA